MISTRAVRCIWLSRRKERYEAHLHRPAGSTSTCREPNPSAGSAWFPAFRPAKCGAMICHVHVSGLSFPCRDCFTGSACLPVGMAGGELSSKEERDSESADTTYPEDRENHKGSGLGCHERLNVSKIKKTVLFCHPAYLPKNRLQPRFFAVSCSGVSDCSLYWWRGR